MISKKQRCSTADPSENNPKIKSYKANEKHNHQQYKKAVLSENTHNDWVENQTEKINSQERTAIKRGTDRQCPDLIQEVLTRSDGQTTV
jgi:hypothetical protein